MEGQRGPYKPRYLLDDANWLLRKSKKADLLIGGTSIVVCCAWAQACILVICHQSRIVPCVGKVHKSILIVY